MLDEGGGGRREDGVGARKQQRRRVAEDQSRIEDLQRAARLLQPMNDRMVAPYERLERGEIEQGVDNLSLFAEAMPQWPV